MKNPAKRGHSGKNGNSPSPYCKYKKRPHRYSPAYYSWRDAILSGKKVNTKKRRYNEIHDDEYKEAA